MDIRLLAFGIARDILRDRTLTWHLRPGSTVGDLKRELHDQFDGFDKLRSLRCAVNTDYVDDAYILKDNDEVVLIPPVSGG